jgi:3-hydroxybutyryl-CoA dehydrogenase
VEPQAENSIRKIAVLGAGTMGHGITQISALAGYDVVLYDIAPELAAKGLERITATLEKGVAKKKVEPAMRDAALARIRTSADLEDAAGDADMVIEAVPEKLALKQSIFESLSKICRPEAILASNTSSLEIGKIAAAATRPERVLGLHFFNPVHIMKLVEIIRGKETSEESLSAAIAAAHRMGKETIVVKDSPGFATSRLGIALGMEAMRMVEEGVASAPDIDKAMELGYGHPMGPLRVSDLVGLDVRLSIADTLRRELNQDHFEAPKILRQMVEEGKLGKKTGQGFYSWEGK